jgi:hypothetical protein
MNARKIQRQVDKDFDKQKARSRVRSKRPTSTSRDGRLALASTVGNRAFGRLLQAKLTIGASNDKYEQVTDRVADAVMRMPEPDTIQAGERDEDEVLRTKPIASQITPLVQRVPNEMMEEEGSTRKHDIRQPLTEHITSLVQRQLESEEEEIIPEEGKIPKEEEELIQTKVDNSSAAEMNPRIESSINSLREGGQSLPKSVRNYFEPRFGYDFSGVRVHTGDKAREAAKSINARAFNIGNDVIFGSGSYFPETKEGKKLLAHELAHVAQQQSHHLNRMIFRFPSIAWWDYKNKGTTSKDNCCGYCPQTLGGNIYPRATYTGSSRAGAGVEFKAYIWGHEKGAKYQIRRTIILNIWSRSWGFWNLRSTRSTTEYPNKNNTCLRPTMVKTILHPYYVASVPNIYSFDAPGIDLGVFRIIRRRYPHISDVVIMANAIEYVIVSCRNKTRRVGKPFKWHAVVWIKEDCKPVIRSGRRSLRCSWAFNKTKTIASSGHIKLLPF